MGRYAKCNFNSLNLLGRNKGVKIYVIVIIYQSILFLYNSLQLVSRSPLFDSGGKAFSFYVTAKHFRVLYRYCPFLNFPLLPHHQSRLSFHSFILSIRCVTWMSQVISKKTLKITSFKLYLLEKITYKTTLTLLRVSVVLYIFSVWV